MKLGFLFVFRELAIHVWTGGASVGVDGKVHVVASASLETPSLLAWLLGVPSDPSPAVTAMSVHHHGLLQNFYSMVHLADASVH